MYAEIKLSSKRVLQFENARLYALFCENAGVMVMQLTASEAAKQLAEFKAEYASDNNGYETFASFCKAWGPVKAGWYAYLENEDCDWVGMYKTREEAVAGWLKNYWYGAREKHQPNYYVTQALLSDYYFGAEHVGRVCEEVGDFGTGRVVVGGNGEQKVKRLNLAYYEKRLYEWHTWARQCEWGKLKKVWGFTPEASALGVSHEQWRKWVGQRTLEKAQEQLRVVMPVEVMRAEAIKAGIKPPVENKHGEWQWVWPANGNQVRDRYKSEKAALHDLCHMCKLCGFLAYHDVL